MPPPDSPASNRATDRAATRTDRPFALALYLIAALAFLPVARWLYQQTVSQPQLGHAFIILAFAGVVIYLEQRRRLQFRWEFSPAAQWLMIASFGLLAASALTHFSLLVLAAFALALASALLFVFGADKRRAVTAFVSAFFGFTLLAALLPVFDWPLRELAGANAGWILDLIGRDASLALVSRDGTPMLMLKAVGQVFHVAPECNGFGVMTASFLLALLLVLYRRIPVLDKLLLLLAAVFTGFVSNILRILVIVLLAPAVGQDNYFLMHEIVGTLFYYGALIVIWKVIHDFAGRPAR